MVRKVTTNASPVGQFGLVYKAVLRNYDGRVVDVAIKTIRKYNSQKEMDNFIREMTVMSQLIHPNIIQLYGVIKESKLRPFYHRPLNLHNYATQQMTGLC